MAKNNTASRMLGALTTALALSDDSPVTDVWAYVFGLEVDPTLSKFASAHRVARTLSLMQEELVLLRDQLKRAQILEGLWSDPLAQIEGAISVHQLSAPWTVGKAYLRPETLLALRFISEMLPNDEDDIDSNELLKLLDDVKSLQALIAHTTLPDSLRQLIARHLEDILRAIDRYKVIGAKAFKPPLDSSMADVYRAKDQIRENAQTPEISSFRAILETLDRFASAVGNYEKVVGIANRVGGYLADLMK